MPTSLPTIPTVSVAQFIADAIDASGRTQQQIADACGFSRPNFISMLKTGKTRVPYERIIPLAQALRVDHRVLARLAIGEYEPYLLNILEKLR